MSSMHAAAAHLTSLLARAPKDGMEMIVLKDPARFDGPAQWLSLDVLMGGRLCYSGEINTPDSASALPGLWLKADLDGEPEHGESGVGIVYNPGIFVKQPFRLSTWLDERFARTDFVRCCWHTTSEELQQKVPDLARVFLPALETCKTCRDKHAGARLTEAHAALLDPAHDLTVVCCRPRNIPWVDSAAGLDAMTRNIRARLDDVNGESQFLLIADDTAAAVSREGDEWQVHRIEQFSSIAGESLKGTVWIRTGLGGAWNTADSGGFGIVADRIQGSLLSGLIKRGYTERRHPQQGQPALDFSAVLQIFAGVAGIGARRRATGPRLNNGLLQSLYHRLDGKQEVSFWWL